MAKLTLYQIKNLEAELTGIVEGKQLFTGIVHSDIPFPVKFRIETKIIPFIQKAVEMIAVKQKELAVINGAESLDKNGYKFKADDKGAPEDVDGFIKFHTQLAEFLMNEDNAIEIDVTIKLSLLGSLKNEAHFSTFCKLIEDDIS